MYETFVNTLYTLSYLILYKNPVKYPRFIDWETDTIKAKFPNITPQWGQSWIQVLTLSLFFQFMTSPPPPVTTKNALGASWFPGCERDGLSGKILVRRPLARTVWCVLVTITLLSTTVIRISNQPVFLITGASSMMWWRSWRGLLFFEKVTFKLRSQAPFFFFLKHHLGIYLFIYLFIFGCVGSSLLCEGFL